MPVERVKNAPSIKRFDINWIARVFVSARPAVNWLEPFRARTFLSADFMNFKYSIKPVITQTLIRWLKQITGSNSQLTHITLFSHWFYRCVFPIGRIRTVRILAMWFGREKKCKWSTKRGVQGRRDHIAKCQLRWRWIHQENPTQRRRPKAFPPAISKLSTFRLRISHLTKCLFIPEIASKRV